MLRMSRSGGLFGAADHDTLAWAGGPGRTLNGNANTPAPTRAIAVPLPARVDRIDPVESMNAPPSSVPNTRDCPSALAALSGMPMLDPAVTVRGIALSAVAFGRL